MGMVGFTRGLAAACMGLLVSAAQAETGVTDTRIRVGQSAVFSGPAADFGNDYRAGITLYFDRVNKAGGVLGRKLELVSLDDGYDPKRTAENTRKLIDDEKVFALIGYVATGNLIAAMPIAEQAGTPMFAPLVGTTSFRTNFNKHLFHVRASYADETEAIVRQLVSLSVSKIAVFYQNDDAGKDQIKGLHDGFGDKASMIVAEKSYEVTVPTVDSRVVALRDSSE